jgi:hypothetical protein
MNERLLDTLTSFVTRAADVLFVQNPRGTSFGVFVGIVLHGATRLFAPALQGLRNWIALERVSVLFWVGAGIVAFNLPLVLRRRPLPDSIEDAFEVIRRLKREGVAKSHIKLQLLALLTGIVQQVNLAESGDRRSPKTDRAMPS